MFLITIFFSSVCYWEHAFNAVTLFCQIKFISLNFYFYLKQILSSVLDSTPFAFSIKLAAAALRKDYSHLEKWLTEKLSLYGKGFAEVICIIYSCKLLHSS